MTGSTHFSLEKSANFGRSFKKLVKALKHLDLVAIVGSCLEGLLVNPYPPKLRINLLNTFVAPRHRINGLTIDI